MAAQHFLKKALPHLVVLLIFLLASALYFSPQLQGKVTRPGDIVSYQAMAKELNDHKKSTGERSWWTNSMFGGMPAYQIEGGSPSNVLLKLEKAEQLYIPRPIGYFFGMCIAMYVLLLYLGANPWLGAIGALGFSFTTGNMLLFEAGHMAKLRVIAQFGIILLGMLMAFKKDYLKGGILFAVGLGLNLVGNHVQMTYYFFLCLLILGIIELVKSIRTGTLPDFAKAAGVLLLALLIGLGSSASKLWTTYEYSKDTMRGDPILVSDASAPKSSSETKGLEWGYAMQWSNGFLDVMSGFIPGLVGGSGRELVGTKSALYKDLRQKGANVGSDFRAPLYWGSLNSTGGPFYLGAIFFFLFILGLFLVPGKMKWWLAISVVFLLILSMGKNFPVLNKLIFDYFPLYNKFRTPNSILTVVAFLLPILGVLGLSRILKGEVAKEEILKALKISVGALAAICLFFGFVAPSMLDISHVGDARLGQAGYDLQALLADRKSLMRSDSLRSLFLVLVAGGAIWGFVQGKLNKMTTLAIIGVFAIGDLWLVDKRYLNSDSFKPKTTSNFVARAADKEILKDKDPNYRVLDLSLNTFSDAFTSYFHKSIGGYHAAKLQRYQDIIDKHLSTGNQSVLSMLNTKYVITQDQQVQRYPNPAGNAWFVSNIKSVNTPNEEIDALKGFDPKAQAVVHAEYADYVAGLSSTGAGQISLTNYEPDHLTYSSNNAEEGLAVFSEVWYGPDKGWNAYLDGAPVQHIRANYLLRALRVPAGNHKIEFKFEPSSYYTGEKITMVFSILLLLAFLWLVGTELMKYWKSVENIKEEVPVVKQPLAQTKSKKKSKKSQKGKS